MASNDDPALRNPRLIDLTLFREARIAPFIATMWIVALLCAAVATTAVTIFSATIAGLSVGSAACGTIALLRRPQRSASKIAASCALAIAVLSLGSALDRGGWRLEPAPIYLLSLIATSVWLNRRAIGAAAALFIVERLAVEISQSSHLHSDAISHPLLTAAVVALAGAILMRTAATTEALAGSVEQSQAAEKIAAAELQRLSEANRINSEREQTRRATLKDVLIEFDTHFLDALDDVVQALKGLNGTAVELTDIAKVTTGDVATAAAATEEASRSVSEVAAATQQLSSAITSIDQQILDAQRLTTNMNHNARATSASVEALDVSVKRIDNILSLIRDVAAKTNLLALNATIEAARAGDAGRGFAVVASEVKTLSKRTAAATEEIAAQIAEIQRDAAGAVGSIRDLSESIADLNQRAIGVASAVEEQNRATHVIIQSIGNVNDGSDNVAYVTSNISESASKTHLIASRVLQSSQQLQDKASHLETAVHKFLQRVATA